MAYPSSGHSNRHGRHPVRGEVSPFQISRFQELKHQLFSGPPDLNTFIEFRDIFKQLIADHMRKTICQEGYFSPLEKDLFLQGLHQLPRYAGLVNFLSCLFDYYNDENLCTHHAISKKKSNGAAKQRVRKKHITAACKSICREFHVDVKPVIQKLLQNPNAFFQDAEQLEHWRIISRAVALFALYFQFLYAQSLPTQISCEIFDSLHAINRKIDTFYQPLGDECYVLRPGKKGKPVAACLEESAGTILFLNLLAGG